VPTEDIEFTRTVGTKDRVYPAWPIFHVKIALKNFMSCVKRDANMANYRRARTPGGTYFFTVVTHRRRPILDCPESRQALRDAIENVRQKYPFNIDAWVLLPEHLHCIWTLPGDIHDFSMRWSLIKSGFSKRTRALFQVEEWMSASRLTHRESTIWQRRFWEHQIRDEEEYQAYMNYIHCNPVKHGHVKRALDWPYSTFHRYVKSGVYQENWCGTIAESDGHQFGE
jgi:putative transposase